MSKFNLEKLPVAPEFVDSLQENSLEVAKGVLKQLGVEEDIIKLVENIYELGYYLTLCHEDPKELLKDRTDRFDIESQVLETINLIAKYGGTFDGPVLMGVPRKGTLLEKVEEE